jgi:transketolase
MDDLRRPAVVNNKSDMLHDRKMGTMRLTRKEIASLETTARELRRDILEITYAAGPERKGHPGGALSLVEIVTALYFAAMRVDPKRPDWPERDRLILSKGHACPVLYAALARRGFFGREAFAGFRKAGGMLQGHPDMKRIPGIDMTAGSLGHGLGAGIGMALAARMDQKDYRTYVILGDGELQEGLVWEGAMSAPFLRLDNLCVIIDRNGLQSCGRVDDTLPLDPLAAKWKDFGWHVLEAEGHSLREILAALSTAEAEKSRPTVIIAATVKGKGFSFMEHDNSWHQKAPTAEQYNQALKELSP